MREDLEELKQRISLLEYLQRRNWTARRVGSRPEFVGFCPLHAEHRPSFYGEVSVAVRIGSWFANQTDRVRLSDVRAG